MKYAIVLIWLIMVFNTHSFIEYVVERSLETCPRTMVECP
jgi:hypothetical protein